MASSLKSVIITQSGKSGMKLNILRERTDPELFGPTLNAITHILKREAERD